MSLSEILLLFLEFISIYLLIIVCLRLLGKKGIAEMSIPDLVMIIIIGEGINSLIPDNRRFVGTVLFVVSIVLMNYLLELAVYKSRLFKRLLEGESVKLIEKGKVSYKHLSKERMTVENLIEALRSKGIARIEEVETAYLETDGKVSVILSEKKNK